MSDSPKTIDDLRTALFATLDGIRNGTVDVAKAKAINDVAKTIVETAAVEVEYLKVTDGGQSEFISSAVGNANLPPGINGVTRHRLR